jgi:uncharacterized protein YndB with AHSA1/START domain
MSTKTEVEPVRKSITVESSVDRAFATFTKGMAGWWPLDTHSVGADREGVELEELVLEGRSGGRLYERLSDGDECDWGRVLVWDPPHRFVMTWHPGYEDPEQHTEVELRFREQGEATLVELEHRGWERLGERAMEARNGYNMGWDFVLGRYTAGFAA